MVEPTPEEADTFNDCDALANWTALPHRPEGGNASSSPRCTFVLLVGAILAALSAALSTLMDGLGHRRPFAEPRPSHQGGGSRPGRSHSLGLAGTSSGREAARGRGEAAADATAPNGSEPAAGKTAAAGRSDAARRPQEDQMSTVAILEVTEMSSEDVEATTGGHPSPRVELTLEQASVPDVLLEGSGPPYVDSSVRAGFGHRISKRVKLAGMMLTADGGLMPREQLLGAGAVL
ncbi:unnamed protein product [Prorocentrum cordatum]|uniref:Uncharacterized protein n=1 Tax=Prorocentrum cordatum TaxID=2364126 RepID=A0ABN9T0C8_9DINO|nr:unnamed protein product [Polarella glacialis]